MTVITTIWIDQNDFAMTAVDQRQAPPLEDGQILLAIEAFALTANNVTYAVVGEPIRYWQFFPAAKGWGVVPVWGHARVVESRHGEIAVGERVYGFLPMASHLVAEPGKIGPALFRDMAAHRQPMSPVYNQYRRLAADPAHDPAREEARMIFEPLFLTSWLIEHSLRAADWHGSDTVIVTSASSKTALGLAHVTRAASPGVRRIGLTGRGNRAFVEGTGVYDDVIDYDGLEAVNGAGRSVIVDFAGNEALLGDLHARLGDRLASSLRVGGTHYEARGDIRAEFAGIKPVWFFAPDVATALIGEIGADAFQAGVAARWAGFVDQAEEWLKVEHARGAEEVVAVWRDLVAGTARPDKGYVASLWAGFGEQA